MNNIQIIDALADYHDEIDAKRSETPYTVNETRLICQRSIQLLEKFTYKPNTANAKLLADTIEQLRDTIKLSNSYRHPNPGLFMNVIRDAQGALEIFLHRVE